MPLVVLLQYRIEIVELIAGYLGTSDAIVACDTITYAAFCLPPEHADSEQLLLIQAHLQDSLHLIVSLPQSISSVLFAPCLHAHHLLDNLIHTLHAQRELASPDTRDQ